MIARRHRPTRCRCAATRTTPPPTGAARAPSRSAAPRRQRGTGCFLVTNPFPAAVSAARVPGDHRRHALLSGSRLEQLGLRARLSSTSRTQAVVDLLDCSGTQAARLRPSTATWLQPELDAGRRTRAARPRRSRFQVELPDCRYVPQACLDLLPPAGDTRGDRRRRARAPDRPRRDQDAGSRRTQQAESRGADAERDAAPAGRGHVAVRHERHAAERAAAALHRAAVARPVGQRLPDSTVSSSRRTRASCSATSSTA